MRSITSHLRLALAIGAGAILVSGCGGNAADSPSTLPSQQPRTMALVASSVQAPATVRMHFRRAQHDEAQWGVYSWWGPVNPSPGWISGRFMMTGTDSFGGFVDIPVDTAKTSIWFLVTDGYGNKNCGNDQGVDFAADIATKGQQIWMLEGDCKIYSSQPAITLGNLSEAKAHWLSASTLVWPGTPAAGSYKLFYAANGGLNSAPEGVTGADGSIDLTLSGVLSPALVGKYPHLASNTALTMSESALATLRAKASYQFAIAQYDAAGSLVQVTSLQSAGMLDALFAAAAASSKLGPSFNAAGVPTFRVWA
ncbi:MAG: pullulanase-associated domain-containing protein, partial [Telluria sp.]